MLPIMPTLGGVSSQRGEDRQTKEACLGFQPAFLWQGLSGEMSQS